jgi:hypothetical protein
VVLSPDAMPVINCAYGEGLLGPIRALWSDCMVISSQGGAYRRRAASLMEGFSVLSVPKHSYASHLQRSVHPPH